MKFENYAGRSVLDKWMECNGYTWLVMLNLISKSDVKYKEHGMLMYVIKLFYS